MCLYEVKMKNPHYLTNEKNGGIIPKQEDERLKWINTKCGWCMECRKEIANAWKVRLIEELKNNENEKPWFITLTYSPQKIEQLEQEMKEKKYKGIGEGEIDVNELAAYSVRMWSERWRKKFKKAPRHWLITELGHQGSERIHMHGIIWTNQPEWITKTWQNGNIYIGKYVNEKTINYITKYVTKVDEVHKNYKQKTFVSKGIGKNYLESTTAKRNKFKGEETQQYYRTPKGYKLALPEYYKRKLYTQEEREELWKIALEKGEIKIGKNIIEKEKTTGIELYNKIKTERYRNEITSFGNGKTTNKKYIITDEMKKEHKKIDLKKTKTAQETTRREIKEIYDNKEQLKTKNGTFEMDIDKIDKSTNTQRIIYGKYIGNTTKAQRNYNKLIEQAEQEKLTVREIRLKNKGLPFKPITEKS